MPSEDAKAVLVDEAGQERDTTYLAKHHGLSARWKRFAREHELVRGDILVFHMITHYIFKVLFFSFRYFVCTCWSSTLNIIRSCIYSCVTVDICKGGTKYLNEKKISWICMVRSSEIPIHLFSRAHAPSQTFSNQHSDHGVLLDMSCPSLGQLHPPRRL